MENKQYRDQKMHRRLERVVLEIYSLFSAILLFAACVGGWNIFAIELICLTVLAGWFVYFKKFWVHERRAEWIAVMAWINFVIYAFHVHDFKSMIPTMAGIIVVLGIFCSTRIVEMGMIISSILFLYHAFIADSIVIESLNDFLKTGMHILAVYTISFVTWLTIRIRQETNEQLMENIHTLEIAERSKDDFMVNVSHEIRTPINAVFGMSEAILQEDLPMDVRKDVIDIQTAGRNLLSTVSNILDFSELESGKMELAEESYNITSTITDIINMALTLENGKHLELIVDCDADLPSNLLGDEQKFRRIVMNLLDNAIKFTKEGGIVLRIKGRKEEYGINLMVSVKDSGIGMEQEDMEKIFTSFSQVNSKRNREEGGVGLGLAITQALVRNMGGFISVKSKPGMGSEFQFTIPQKVLEETPIVSIKNKSHLFAACYLNMDKYNYSVIRDGYENYLLHITEQLGIMFRNCRNLPELKRRMEHENYSHIFISWEEYCEDRDFFEKLAKEITVVLILDYEQETHAASNMLRIYKPFTVLSIAAVFNGHKTIQVNEQPSAPEQRFIAPNAKVLVVDDNAMNLKVMARLLLPYQIKVTMAGGGAEALDKLDSMDFDCVFLDHMMPEMDGVETLHKIRQKPGSYFQSLAVIAFTANAIGGAREMFLSEGFDDFIAKPIELSVLERMLRRYIPVQKQIKVEEDVSEKASGAAYDKESSLDTDSAAGASFKPSEAASPEDTDPATSQSAESQSQGLRALTLAGINIQQGITYCGDKEGFRDILAIYHTEGAKRKSQLQHFFDEQDWKNYVITVHALKSNSKGIGANELAELALNLEMAGKENRIDFILKHHDELMEQHDALLHTLSDNLFLYPDGYQEAEPDESADTADSDKHAEDANKTSPTSAGEDEETEQKGEMISLRDLVAMLREKLESFESEGLENILEHLAECHKHDNSLPELVEKIRDKVNDFDFLGGSEILDSWEEKHPME